MLDEGVDSVNLVSAIVSESERSMSLQRVGTPHLPVLRAFGDMYDSIVVNTMYCDDQKSYNRTFLPLLSSSNISCQHVVSKLEIGVDKV